MPGGGLAPLGELSCRSQHDSPSQPRCAQSEREGDRADVNELASVDLPPMYRVGIDSEVAPAHNSPRSVLEVIFWAIEGQMRPSRPGADSANGQ